MENKININWINCVPETEVQEKQVNKDLLTYCIIRTYSAWVRAGRYDLSKVNMIGTVYEARRLRERRSDFTLSALAVKWSKTGKEWENKYAMPVSEVYLTQIIEVIPCTEVAKKFIRSVPNYAK